MLPPAAAPEHVVKAIAEIEASLDDVVNHGSDDELFVASYLQGHFAVESRQLEMREDASIAMLNDKMVESLNEAFANNELESEDAKQVKALWDRLVAIRIIHGKSMSPWVPMGPHGSPWVPMGTPWSGSLGRAL